jgi:hypothetical protein
MNSLPSNWPTLPECPTGREMIGTLNRALELSTGGGGIFFGSGAVQQRVRDAINAPKTELGVEIPFWPWSEEPRYCDGTWQRAHAQLLMEDLAAEPENADKKNEEIEQKVKDAVGGWWATLAGWLRWGVAIAAVFALAWLVRSFRSVT